ncbi:hypothetical protein C8Q77DRAFT_484759 [Trametes polyzona]|nr:hypothetical protein C8Q77DRAFT_484759 [Trametes polyzona]
MPCRTCLPPLHQAGSPERKWENRLLRHEEQAFQSDPSESRTAGSGSAITGESMSTLGGIGLGGKSRQSLRVSNPPCSASMHSARL